MSFYTHINFVIFLSVIGDGARGYVYLPGPGKCLVCCSSTYNRGHMLYAQHMPSYTNKPRAKSTTNRSQECRGKIADMLIFD